MFKMNSTTNNQQNCDTICKKSCRLQSHERDLYRVCPSKLSKRELENLYFALLDNNIELKKSLHSQQDKIKILSTKLQRMTVVQRNAAGKEKDCCNSKVVVNEQKEIITDLKNANEQLGERVRLLNMRLCSAKQFLKKSPAQLSKCPRCGICPVVVKNSSMSVIEARTSQTSLKMAAASCQYISTEASEVPKSTREVGTETDQIENEGTEKQCNENKCRSVMDEMKQKIVGLQEELSKTHDEYSQRISKLENDVSGLHQENITVRSSKAVSEHALQQRDKKADELKGKLREAEGKARGYSKPISKLDKQLPSSHQDNMKAKSSKASNDLAFQHKEKKRNDLSENLKEAERKVSEYQRCDLKMQLAIEKRKVKELETSLKLAHTSSQAVKMMEDINTPKPAPAPMTDVSGSVSSYYSVKQDASPTTPKKSEQNSNVLLPSSTKLREEEKFPKSDDSGCTDLNKSDADESKLSYIERLNQDMLKKIADLQMQLDDFRIKAAGLTAKPEIEKSLEQNLSYEYDDEMQMTVINITDPNVTVEIQQLGDKLENFQAPEERKKKIRELGKKINVSQDLGHKRKDVQDLGEKRKDSQELASDRKNFQDVGEKRKDFQDKAEISKDSMSQILGANRKSFQGLDENKKDDLYIKRKSFHDLDKKRRSFQEVGEQPINSQRMDEKFKGINSPRGLDASTPIKTKEPSGASSKVDSVNAKSWNDLVTDMARTSEKDNQYSTKGISIDDEKSSPRDQRPDSDNRYQIPGPIPTCCQPYKDKRRSSKNLKTDKILMDNEVKGLGIEDASISKISGQAKNDFKTDDTASTSKANETPLKFDQPKESNQKITFVDPLDKQADDAAKTSEDQFSARARHRDTFARAYKPEENKFAEDAKKTINEIKSEKDGEGQMKNESNLSYFSRSNERPLRLESKEKLPNGQTVQTENEYFDGQNDFEQCLSRATVCRCPRATRREVNVFRTCSGTLRFHTIAPNDKFRHCDCARLPDTGGPVDVGPCRPASPIGPSSVSPTGPQSVFDQNSATPTMVARRDSVTSATPARQVSATSASPAHQISATSEMSTRQVYASAEAPARQASAISATAARRDSATYTAMPARQDSATSAAPARRDSATSAAPAHRESATSAMYARRDSATYTAAPVRRDSATYTAMPARLDSATFTKPGELEECKCERATSPANTERDVSSLSDLPPEKDSRSPRATPLTSPRDARSPGEEKVTTTYTDTETRTNDYGLLSDGELPMHTTFTRPRTLSFGEKPTYAAAKSSEAQMEATLNAISEELAHCRKMLAAARDHEVRRWDRTS